MSIAAMKELASTAMKGNRLLLTVGFVLPLVMWTTVAQIFITIFGMDAVLSIITPFFEGWNGFEWSYLLLPILLILLFILGDFLHISYRWFGIDFLESKPLDVKLTFQAFFKENRGKVFKLVVLRGAIVFAWSLLFILPGIWKAYLYSQAGNNLKTNPSMTPMEAMNLSEEQMKDNSKHYAILQVTFAPWYAIPIGLVIYFIATNTFEIQTGLELGTEGAQLIYGVFFAVLSIAGLLLILFSLYVEPYKMVSKQVFYKELINRDNNDTYDDFEKELLEKQGLTRKPRRNRQITPKL